MSRHSIRHIRLLLHALVCTALLGACAVKQPLPQENAYSGADRNASAQAVRPGKNGKVPVPQLFQPLESYRVHTLTDAEAAALVRQLSPAAQGLRSWNDMDFALAQSMAFAAAKPASAYAIQRPDLTVTWGELAGSLAAMKTLLPRLDHTPQLLASSFRWVRLGPDFSFTGYYEPTLKASKKPTAQLNYPLYAVPRDLRRGVPYHTRQAIDRQGALRGKGLEIAWVNETDAYFLHVQGSGRLLYPDGSTSHVLYADKNNRKYVSLGRVMKEAGLLPEDGVNMKAIRAYLAANPHKRSELFDTNPSYVFFSERTSGPLGSMGRVLTPRVSVAVDRGVIAQGSLIFVSVPLPDASGAHTNPFHALTLPQDSGGAIKGHRLDLFFGAGDDAAHLAGHLDIKGAVYLLLPRK